MSTLILNVPHAAAFSSVDSATISGFRLGHRPALDGLRGISILAVLILHLNSIYDFGFRLLGGGFLGVDMFFVISGFLITLLLVEESARSGSINLVAFYRRRALRLLPALIAAIAFCLLIALLAGSLTGIGMTPLRLASTLFYFTNWIRVFESGDNWLLAHFWSLSIEEQFYLLWPLVLITLRGRPRLLMQIVLAIIALSCALKAVLFLSGASHVRLYYGSDTRADAILIGCLLGLLLHLGRLPAVIAHHHAVIGRVAWIVFSVLLVVADWRSPFAYFGGFTFAALVSAMIVLRSVLSPPRILLTPALTWIGKRCYGLYVWHWPVYMLAALGPKTLVIPLALFGTLLFAAVSYRYIESPFLRMKRRKARVQESITSAHVDTEAVAVSLAR